MQNQHHLPQEIWDHIVDLFHDDLETLKRCCLVSKSWVPRTQKHLFSCVALTSADYPKWRKTFPNPTDSPARYTQTLTIDGTLGGAEEMRCIESFSRVEQLIVRCPRWPEPLDINYLSPFYKLAPSVRSLFVDSPVFLLSQVFNLIPSLPLLENLTLVTEFVDDRAGAKLPTPAPSPALTGFFDLVVLADMGIILRLLLGLEGGLRFRELRLSCCKVQDLASVEGLVLACSDTLESFDIACRIQANEAGSIDLSKATKLKDVVFRCRSLNSAWITSTLRTITPKHQNLLQITIYVAAIRDHWFDRTIIDHIHEISYPLLWSDLDRLLVEFWELRSIPSKIECSRTRSGSREAKDWAEFLVPELMKLGILDPVDVEEPRYLST